VRRHRVQSRCRRGVNRGFGSVFALLLLAAVAGCGTNQATTGGTGSTAPAAPHQVSASAGSGDAVPHRLAASFALLRAPADGMPARVKRALHVPFHGMLWDQSRRLPVLSPDEYWLAPGTKYVCIVALSSAPVSVGTVCATIQEALRHGIANTSLGYESGERTIVGVAPDGVRSVLMHCRKSNSNIRVRHDGIFTLRDAVMEGPERFALRYHSRRRN
jgi:hypothetical protein